MTRMYLGYMILFDDVCTQKNLNRKYSNYYVITNSLLSNLYIYVCSSYFNGKNIKWQYKNFRSLLLSMLIVVLMYIPYDFDSETTNETNMNKNVASLITHRSQMRDQLT